MRTLLLSVMLMACSKDEPAQKPSAEAPEITVEQLDAKLTNREWQPVDANGEATRKKMGVIPGAVLLTDSEAFSLSELPADKSKPLVFYCANTHCDASDQAAGRALTAGYTNVKVLPAGIAGWVEAGKKVQNI
jgi:rhodanese-related sulfurtransferase